MQYEVPRNVASNTNNNNFYKKRKKLPLTSKDRRQEKKEQGKSTTIRALANICQSDGTKFDSSCNQADTTTSTSTSPTIIRHPQVKQNKKTTFFLILQIVKVK